MRFVQTINYEKLTPTVLKDYRNGIPGTVIAANQGVSIDTVYRVLRKAGYHAKRINYSTIALPAIPLYEQGLSCVEIADKLNVNAASVS